MIIVELDREIQRILPLLHTIVGSDSWYEDSARRTIRLLVRTIAALLCHFRRDARP